MSDHKHDKKQKKLAQLIKNRKLQTMNFQAETLARERDLDREREEEERDLAAQSGRTAAKKAADAKPTWSARMQEIRDKNTGRTREAKDRWNRFAGTESGGGRGL
jgi:hypothetical protein